MSEEKTDWDFIQETIDKSESDFEQKLTYISAGSLVLSLTLIEKIIKIENSSVVIFLIIGWTLLALTLLINLISHLISKRYLKEAQRQITDSVDISERRKSIQKNNKRIENLNVFTVVLLILGIIFIIIFSSVNAYQKSNHQDTSSNKEFKISVPSELINKNDSIILINFSMSKEEKKINPNEGGDLNEGRSIPVPKVNPDILKKGRSVPEPKEPTPKPQEKEGK